MMDSTITPCCHTNKTMPNNQNRIGNPTVVERYCDNGLNGYFLSASSSFSDDFPLPFQEVTEDEYYAQRNSAGGLACIAPTESVREQRVALLTHNPIKDPSSPTPLHKQQRVVKERTKDDHGGDAGQYGSRKQFLPPQQGVSASSVPRHIPSPSSPVLQRQTGVNEPLPPNFAPKPWSVVIGRDKMSLDAVGNQRLHVLASCYLHSYTKSRKDKDEKSYIISEIESSIRNAYGNGKEDTRGAFIKYQDGKWWEVEAPLIREKIGRVLRELLHTKYASSSRQKRARRRHSKKNNSNSKKSLKTTGSDADKVEDPQPYAS